jgi:hypothetical protein
MPYAAEISRTKPSCFLFLVDQSGSMVKPFAGQPGRIKAQGVADAINRLLHNIVLKCAKSEGVRDYFHVGVIGYGSRVGPALGGFLANRPLVPISEIANHPMCLDQRTKKVEDGVGGLVEENVTLPLWFEPTAKGKTPMCQAFTLARQTIAEFIKKHPACFPPLVLNITDGVATDGSPEPLANALSHLTTSDGNVLVFNAHLSSRPDKPVEFPDKEEGLPDDFARMLFRMSSLLPVKMQSAARNEGLRVGDATRGFVFNADLVSIIRFLDIGTKAAQNLR